MGAELHVAIAEREQFLRGLGIVREPLDQCLSALRKLERLDIARKLAAEQGAMALTAPLHGMHGRMLSCGQSAAGVPLVYVLDPVRRRLVVLPSPLDAADLLGGHVTIGRDATGRPVIRAEGRGKGR